MQVDDPELEKSIKQDVAISIKQLDVGNAKSLKSVMKAVRAKIEKTEKTGRKV